MKHDYLGINPMASAKDIAEQVKRPIVKNPGAGAEQSLGAATTGTCAPSIDAPRAEQGVRFSRPGPRSNISVRYAELIAALVQTQPGQINFVADAHDLDDRAEHITAVGKAFAQYVEELIDDTAAKLNTGSIDRDAHFQILDTISDLSGQLSRIAQDLAERSDW